MFLRITQGFWKERRAALKRAASNNQTFNLRGIKFRVLRAELKDWVCLLGKESVVCTDQPHSYRRTTLQKPGRPSLEFLFLGKVGRNTGRDVEFCASATHIHHKNCKIAPCYCWGYFCSVTAWFDVKKMYLLLILYIEVLGICNCSVGMHPQFLEMGKDRQSHSSYHVCRVTHWK